MSADQKLKTCPHCGSPAEFLCADDCRPYFFAVQCTNNDCGPWRKTESEAINYWNIRADLADETMAALRELVEAHLALIKAYLTPDELTVFRRYCGAWENARRVAGVEQSK